MHKDIQITSDPAFAALKQRLAQPANTIGCKCGAVQATQAGFAQMSLKRQNELLNDIRKCPTCKKDKENGHL